jgi:hypothetical protein
MASLGGLWARAHSMLRHLLADAGLTELVGEACGASEAMRVARSLDPAGASRNLSRFSASTTIQR